jgi:hypothetical protein
MSIVLIFVCLQDPEWTGKLDLRSYVMEGQKDASRYFEYRDFPLPVQLALLEIDSPRAEEDTATFSLRITELAQETMSLSMEWARLGEYKMSLTWDRIPHRYGFNATTLYTGVGTSHMEIANATQAALQGLTPLATANTLRGFVVAGSRDEDGLGIQRDRIAFDFEWMTGRPWRVDVGIEYEQKEGMRPKWGSFGFGTTVQVVEPIEYSMWTFRIGAAYIEKPIDLHLTYSANIFESREDSLVWDNPFRSTDIATNTSQGRQSLESGNLMHHLSFVAGYDVSTRVRVNAQADWSYRYLRTLLQPYTINTVIVPPVLPDDDFTGQVFTSRYQLSMNLRPLDPIDLKIYGRIYQFEDHREEIVFPGFVRTDTTLTVAQFENEPLSYSQWAAGFTETIRLSGINSKIKPGYEYRQWDRENRQVGKVVEHAVQLGFDTRWSDAVQTQITAGAERREGVGAKKIRDRTELLFMEMKDQSDRERFLASIGMTLAFSDQATASLKYAVTYDDYDVEFGLRNASWHQGLVDVSIGRWLSVYAAYDQYETRQKGRQWVPGGAGDPSVPASAATESPSNWHVIAREYVYTVGLRPEWEIIENTFRASADVACVWNRSWIGTRSPIGPAAVDANAFEPLDLFDAENSERISVHARLTYTPAEKVEFYVGYHFDSFMSENFYNDGISPVPILPNGNFAGAYPLRLRYEDATLHLGYIGFSVRY